MISGLSNTSIPTTAPSPGIPLSSAATSLHTGRGGDADATLLTSRSDALRAFGLQPSSRLSLTDEALSFDFEYRESRSEQISASGWYAREERSLALSLSYSFSRFVLLDGVMLERSFKVEIQIAAKDIRTQELRPYKEPEDIVKFLRRIVDEIFDVSQDDSKFLAGIVFDLDDLAELAHLDKGRVLKMIAQFVQMVQYLARLKDDAVAGENDREAVLLHPKRVVAEGLNGSDQIERSLDIRISIQEAATRTLPPPETENRTEAPV